MKHKIALWFKIYIWYLNIKQIYHEFKDKAIFFVDRQDNSGYHHLGLASGGNDGFLNGQHPNDPSLDKLQGYIFFQMELIQ